MLRGVEGIHDRVVILHAASCSSLCVPMQVVPEESTRFGVGCRYALQSPCGRPRSLYQTTLTTVCISIGLLCLFSFGAFSVTDSSSNKAKWQ